VLSEWDRQVLAAMERSLAAQDPAPAARVDDRAAPGPARRRRGSRWAGVVGGVLAGLVAPVVVLVTVPALPAVMIVIVLALLGRVVAMCGADDSSSTM
jgi:predicted lipid-binding transport protein (Tim44 family)